MRKIFLTLFLLTTPLFLFAQVKNVKFGQPKDIVRSNIISTAGEPSKELSTFMLYNNIAYEGHTWDEALFLFSDKGDHLLHSISFEYTTIDIQEAKSIRDDMFNRLKGQYNFKIDIDADGFRNYFHDGNRKNEDVGIYIKNKADVYYTVNVVFMNSKYF